MATKKSTKKVGRKKQSSKSGDAKKLQSKQPTTTKGRKGRRQIPPVIVGGGSIRIWLRNDHTKLSPTPNPLGLPVGFYDCFEFKDTKGTRIRVHDGKNEKPPVEVEDARKLGVIVEGSDT